MGSDWGERRGVASLSPTWRAIALLALLVGSSLLAASPAQAQATLPIICFGGPDRHEKDAGCLEEGRISYPQGASVDVLVPGYDGTGTWLSARCSQGCPVGDPSASRIYYARYEGGTVVFPRDFIDAGPPGASGGNAVLDRAPRYNSTWTVAMVGAPVQRSFDVWLYDAYQDDQLAMRPGASHMIRATGFDPGATVQWRWERRDPFTGRFDIFASGEGRANPGGAHPGWFELSTAFTRTEATNIAACGEARFDCYRVTLSGAGKQTETVNVQVDLANLTRSEATTPRPEGTAALQRTMNATADIDLYYPGGRVQYGPKVGADDAPNNVGFGFRAFRVQVEKYWAVNDSTVMLTEVPLVFDASRQAWRAQWTIPKDIPIEDGQVYRLRLIPQKDVHGNRVVEDILLSFTIEEAEIVPTITRFWRDLQRTEQGTLRLAVLYHNGSAFTINDTRPGNASPLSGCYVYIPPPPESTPPPPQVESCGTRPRTWGRYYDGAWNFTVRYPRGYENLGQHRFILDNDTVDRWGNQIFSMSTPVFNVVRAQPNVNVSTVMRGEETNVLERGNRIFVSATITYHDGTPYNAGVREDPTSQQARVLNGTLLRRGPAPDGSAYGPIASEERFDLTLTDPSAGRWTGTLQLTDDDTYTPVGVWTFRYEIEDNLTVPNYNLTTFDREVVSSTIQVCPTYQPAARLSTGNVQKFRFKLYYSECDTGREVPPGVIESKLSLRVLRFDPQQGAPNGTPLSNAIVPTFDAELSREWGIEYEIPNELFTGTYVFVVEGADAFGNRVVSGARSRPFQTFTDILTRSVLTQPREEVRRGDTATVVFDAREGDTGVDPARPPRIQLERFDTSTTTCPLGIEQGGCWVRERLDVRVPDGTFEDHVGVFPVGVDTPVGLYRFSLQGRDSAFRVITGLSANFTVDATQVTRPLLTTPPEITVKGAPFSFHVEHAPGDVVNDRVVFFNGRPIVMPPPVVSFEPGRMNVTWGIPFDAPTGNYTLRLSGRDVNGNIITILTPPIEASPAALEGRLLGQPTRVVERGEEARVLFGVAYPDGGFYAASDTPRVYVRNGTSIVADAVVRREGLTFAAFWTPDAETPLGEYHFEVSQAATGGTGNLFPPLSSNTFRLAPGVVRRNPIDDAPVAVERFGSIAFSAPLERDDRFVGFELVFYGPSLSNAIDPTAPPVEVSRTGLTHTIDAIANKYVARFTTDHRSQTGSFRIVMTGEDAHGNTIISESRRFVVRPTTISVLFDPQPDDDAFGEGKTITISFVARYGVGRVLDETLGKPSATVLFNNQPVQQRPEVEFRDGRWFMSWTAPAMLPWGEYQFMVGGFDLQGNPIANVRSNPYLIAEPSLSESFAKTIPGANPVLVVLAVAALAAVLARRRSR